MDVEMNKPGPNGTPGAGFATPAYAAPPPPSTTSTPTQTLGIVLRAVAVALTLISAIVMGIAKETVIVNLYDTTTGELVDTVSVPAKSVQYSAYVYFIAANVIVFAYSSLSMAVSIGRRTTALGISTLLPILDVVMVALLFSCNGATAAITLVAEKGNDNAGWGKFCNAYNNYCGRVTAALVLSMIAAVAYVKLLIFSIISLQKR
ncbi:CASP-like protein 1E1 [Iris pallida]|uniref:CASP-like protein n=1 Tax=Iris pallida TaxID=29817 RepID=A0AAX6FDK0_IRIPA|nr:CASP-like protein 1E1 [Iris pallida]